MKYNFLQKIFCFLSLICFIAAQPINATNRKRTNTQTVAKQPTSIQNASAFSTPPVNDDCINASVLPVGATCVTELGDVSNATESTGILAASCIADPSPKIFDVWYKFTATMTTLTVEVTGSQEFDPVIEIYSSCPTTGSNVAIDCADANTFKGGIEKITLTNLIINNTYYVRVYNWAQQLPQTTLFYICAYTSQVFSLNDECANAISINPGANYLNCNPITVNTTGATRSPQNISCASNSSDDDVWYKFVANSSKMIVKVSNIQSPVLGVGMALYDGCNGTESAECEAAIPNDSLEFKNLTTGSTYYLRVYTYGVADKGTFDMCVYKSLSVISVTNDECSSAQNLVVGTSCITVTGNVVDATESAAPITCTTFKSDKAYDVWYKFTATMAELKIDVTGSVNFDAVAVLYSTCNGTMLDCADINGEGETETINATGLTPGNVYYVRVYHFGTLPNTTTFDICVSSPPLTPPANDNCSNATGLIVGAMCASITGDLSGATQSMPPASCNGIAAAANDVWYTFTATAASQAIDVFGSAGLDVVVVLYNLCNGSILGCSDNGGGIGTVEHVNGTGLTVGNVYMVRVYAYNSNPTTTTFDICVHTTTSSTPANDACSNAIALTVGSMCIPVTGDVSGATKSTAPASCNGTAATANDVWYKFTATASSQTIDVTGSSDFDAVVVLYDVCFGTLLDCSDNGGGVGTSEQIYATGLTVGNTYLIRLYAYNSNPTTTTFDICVHATTVPVNDECTGAISISTGSNISNCSPVTVNTASATKSANSISCATTSNDDDVWYQFTTLDSSVIVKGSNLGVGVTGIGMALYTGCNGNQSVECEVSAPGDSLLFNNLTIGNTYYLRLFTYGSINTGQFDICVYNPLPIGVAPINNDCSGSISLSSGNVCTSIIGNVSFATQSAAAELCNAFTSPSAYDVWYNFKAKTINPIIEVTGEDDFDPVISLYSGCSGSLMDCADNTYLGGTEMMKDSLIIGNVYYVRVYHYGNSFPSNTNFNICVYDNNIISSVKAIEYKEVQLLVYPNPTTGILKISLENINLEDNSSLKLFGSNGQLIINEQINSAGVFSKEVNLSDYPQGIYYVTLTNNSGTIVKKIILTK